MFPDKEFVEILMLFYIHKDPGIFRRTNFGQEIGSRRFCPYTGEYGMLLGTEEGINAVINTVTLCMIKILVSANILNCPNLSCEILYG